MFYNGGHVIMRRTVHFGSTLVRCIAKKHTRVIRKLRLCLSFFSLIFVELFNMNMLMKNSMHTALDRREFFVKNQIATMQNPFYSPDLAPCDIMNKFLDTFV